MVILCSYSVPPDTRSTVPSLGQEVRAVRARASPAQSCSGGRQRGASLERATSVGRGAKPPSELLERAQEETLEPFFDVGSEHAMAATIHELELRAGVGGERVAQAFGVTEGDLLVVAARDEIDG